MKTSIASDLKKTPLDAVHRHLQAKMVPFGGWEMPLQYAGILAEYQYTRQGVAVFDTSHMGEFLINGDAQTSGLETIVTQPLSGMPVNTGRYGMMCNEDGGVLDDLIVFRLKEDQWFLIVNAGTTESDAAHIQRHLSSGICFENISWQTGKLDVQGPAARDVLRALIPEIDELNYFTFKHFNILGQQALVSRTGYTGELGYELFIPWETTQELWEWLLAHDVQPAGLGVRDVLRLEMGYSLYGHELSPQITPLEAGLSRFIDWDKDFIGRGSLLRQKQTFPARRNIGLVSCSRRSPRAGHTIFDLDGRSVGMVTSGTFSPSLNLGIGLGLVEYDFQPQEGRVRLGESHQPFAAEIVRPPFYTQGTLKQ